MKSAGPGGPRLRARPWLLLASASLLCAPAGAAGPLEIFGNPAAEVTVNEPYIFLPTVDRTERDVTFEIENKPAWAWFDARWGRIDGVPTAADVGQYTDIRITAVSGDERVTLPAFGITVSVPEGMHNVVLTWMAPTDTQDGGMLTDLIGFRIYGGETPDTLRRIATVANPNRNRFSISDRVPVLRHFALSAVSRRGLESELSAVISVFPEAAALEATAAVALVPMTLAPMAEEPAIFPDIRAAQD